MTDALRAGLAACGVAPPDRVLVAVSGGVDSTVLLRLLAEVGQPVVAAHVDHRLRPDSARAGEAVAALADDLGVPFVGLAVSVGEGNVQAEARQARYAALGEAARANGCPFVATGHTATDQAETVLLALVRGAGLRGLAGMPPRRALGEGVDLIRPLLHIPRSEVEEHASSQGWGWLEDPSNVAGTYRRNRLRHNVLPMLREEGGNGTDLRIAAAAASARSALGLVSAHPALVESGPGRIAVTALAGHDASARTLLLSEAVAAWAPGVRRSRALLARLAALVDAEVGSLVESGGLRAWRERRLLRLGASEETGLDGWLDVRPLPAVPDGFGSDPFVETVDADRAAGDLVVRFWHEGDRIRPLGLDGTQLVSDLLRSRGVPRSARGRVPVVEVGGRVAWVVGHRLAADVAITESTRRSAEWAWREGDRAR